MKAVILAGGRSTKLLPLTKDFPEVILPIGNIPLIFYQMELLKEIGVNEVIITSSHDPRYSKFLLGEGENFGVKITYLVEDKVLGTAGAIKNAAHLLEDYFMVINGDILLCGDLSEAINSFKNSNAHGLLVVSHVENLNECGMALVNGGGVLKNFIEKPKSDEISSGGLANTGVYFFKRDILDFIPDGQYYSIERELLPLLINEKNILIKTFKTENYWRDIGTIENYRLANFDFLNEKVTISEFFEKRFISEFNRDKRYVIGNDTIVKSGVKIRNSVIGAGCIIEDNVVIEDSIIWNGVTIKEGSFVNGAIICKGCLIGKGVKLVRNTVLGNDTVISDFSKLG